MIEIKAFQKVKMDGATFIEGFPGVGLVGPMAISYIIDKLGLDYIGYIESSDFPPLISIHKDKPMPPIRLYYSGKHAIFTVFAEFAIPVELTYELSNKLYDFVKSNGIAKIISVGGIPSQTTDETAFAIASNDALKKDIRTAGLKPVGEGVATGVSALLLTRAVLGDMPDISILVPTDPNIIDPAYAEIVINAINKLMGLNIDVTELEKEAKEIEARVREVMKKNRETHDTYKKAVEGAGPSMYA
jgi:uncharacterized protein